MIGWLVAAASEVPEADAFLSPLERAALARLAVPKRRADYRLGRFVAHRALDRAWARDHGADPPRWCVRPAEDGAPEAFTEDGAPAPFAVSISHSEGLGACAVAPRACAIGCDLERIAPRSDALVRQFFTGAEQARVRAVRDPARAATLVWASKEAALKSLRAGLREDTRAVEIAWDPSAEAEDAWWSTTATYEGRALRGALRVIERGEGGWAFALTSEPHVDLRAL